MGRVMEDSNIIGMFSDPELTLFVKLAVSLNSGDVVYDLSLQQVLPVMGCDLSSLSVYLDLQQVFHEIGVDLVSAGPDPMTAPEAFGLKLLWPSYMENDEKYLAVLIAGILVTRYERNTDHLPKYSMHLTEVGMHLKALEAVDAALAWSLPILKTDGLRLARFLSKPDTGKYFSVIDSPCHHSDKVVSLNAECLWRDAEQLWSALELQELCSSRASIASSGSISTSSSGIEDSAMSDEEREHFLEGLTKSCAELAISEEGFDSSKDSESKKDSFNMVASCGENLHSDDDFEEDVENFNPDSGNASCKIEDFVRSQRVKQPNFCFTPFHEEKQGTVSDKGIIDCNVSHDGTSEVPSMEKCPSGHGSQKFGFSNSLTTLRESQPLSELNNQVASDNTFCKANSIGHRTSSKSCLWFTDNGGTGSCQFRMAR